MLRSSLKPLGVPVEALLAAAGIPPTARAEELSVAEFCALARALEFALRLGANFSAASRDGYSASSPEGVANPALWSQPSVVFGATVFAETVGTIKQGRDA